MPPKVFQTVPPTPADSAPPVSMRRVAGLFRTHRGRLIVVLVLIIVSAAISMASPFLLRALLDHAIPERNGTLVAWLAVGMVVVAVVTNAIDVVESYLSNAVGQEVMHQLRSDVYRHLQRMSLAFFTRTRTGEVQSRIANDIGGMQSVVTSTATSLASNGTTVLATSVAMIVLDWRLAVMSFILVPFFAVLTRRVGGERKRTRALRQRQMANLSALVEESLSVSGIMLGKTMGRMPTLGARFDERSEELADLEMRTRTSGQWRMATISITFAIMPAIVYLVAGIGLAGGASGVSVGTLVAFTTLQTQLFRPIVQLLSISLEIQASQALFARIFEYLDLPVEITERAGAVTLDRNAVRGEVRFEHLSFAYDSGGPPALADIDVTVPAGSTLAVVGPTGSGKTTLGYIVARLYDPTAGRITIDGVDLRDLAFDSLTGVIGIVSQETYLFHDTIRENLRFARPGATDEELEAAARTAQIHDLITSLPDGYDTPVGERGYRFSGGEKQRLAIARAILRDPPVLVLDEATSALDTRTERALGAAQARRGAGRTTITIAHRLSTIRNADLIVVIEAGRIAERGRHDELLALGGRYAALVAAANDPLPDDDGAADVDAETESTEPTSPWAAAASLL